MPARIALAQLDVRLGDLAENEARARTAVRAAAERGADVVIFSELQLSGYVLRGVESETAIAADELPQLDGPPAALFGFHERNGSGTHNSAAFVDEGRLVHVQRKVRLVEHPPFHEDAVFTPGDAVHAFDTSIGRIATIICNDAWQPMLPALAVQDGARMLLIPSASPTVMPDIERYWHDLTRFYAQMLQCYVVFVNRVGTERGLTFWGGSHVVDPYGRLVAEAPRATEDLLVVDIDLGLVDECRLELPIVGDPRLDVLVSELGRQMR